MQKKVILAVAMSILFLCNCGNPRSPLKQPEQPIYSKSELPVPYATPSVIKECKVIGWPEKTAPIAPEGFSVTLYADQINSPRWFYETRNGDVLVSCSLTDLAESPNQVILLRDKNDDGIPDDRIILFKDLHQPLGMLVLDNWLYIANTDALVRYPYTVGQSDIREKPEKIIDLPAGGYNNHWTRNILANRNGTKIYVTVGSGSDNGENGMEAEIGRATILEINPDGTGKRIFASGLRNPVGMDWQPGTDNLWAVVNERDELGDELVPDFLTNIKDSGFYGWPYSYFGANEDPRMKGLRPDLVRKAIVPDVSLDAHSAPLGLAFYTKKVFPAKYHNGAFIGLHGSWNRSNFEGYKVVFIPFVNGKPGLPEDFLTGFIADEMKNEVYGRPVGVMVTNDGSLLVADDSGNKIWKISNIK